MSTNNVLCQLGGSITFFSGKARSSGAMQIGQLASMQIQTPTTVYAVFDNLGMYNGIRVKTKKYILKFDMAAGITLDKSKGTIQVQFKNNKIYLSTSRATNNQEVTKISLIYDKNESIYSFYSANNRSGKFYFENENIDLQNNTIKLDNFNCSYYELYNGGNVDDISFRKSLLTKLTDINGIKLSDTSFKKQTLVKIFEKLTAIETSTTPVIAITNSYVYKEFSVLDSLSDIEKDIVMSSIKRGRPLALSGPPGCGKTTLIKEYAQLLSIHIYQQKDKIEVLDLSLNENSNFASLFGTLTIMEDNQIEFVPGLFLQKRENIVINCDEVTRTDNNNFDALLGLFAISREDPRLFTIPIPNSSSKIDIGWADAIHHTDVSGKEITNEEHYILSKELQFGISDKNKTKEQRYVYLFKNSWTMTFTMNSEENAALYEFSEAFSRRIDHLHMTPPGLLNLDSDGVDIITKFINKTLKSRYITTDERTNYIAFLDKVEPNETNKTKDVLIANVLDIIKVFNVPDTNGFRPCRGIGYGVMEAFIESFIVSDLADVNSRYQKAYLTSLKKYIENDNIFHLDVDQDQIKQVRNKIRQICKVLQ